MNSVDAGDNFGDFRSASSEGDFTLGLNRFLLHIHTKSNQRTLSCNSQFIDSKISNQPENQPAFVVLHTGFNRINKSWNLCL